MTTQAIEKFASALKTIPFENEIPAKEKSWLESYSNELNLSFQQIKIILEYSRDIKMWQEKPLSHLDFSQHKKLNKKLFFNQIKKYVESLKDPQKKTYEVPEKKLTRDSALSFGVADTESKIISTCPVYSDKTLCCNLQTLDVALNCAFGCTYCSIQSFYEGQDTILMEENLEQKLDAIPIDPNLTYHIGTGQSSDSLLWGNKNGNLETLFNWARKHPNVILELKTKSKNIKFLLETDLPKNLLFTWTMNPDVVIQNEELYTASLEERLRSARKLADKGHLVGFHFHPMFYFDNCEQEYAAIVKRIVNTFDVNKVALISLGTLTFTPSVIKEIRQKKVPSKVLQMPMVEADGKLSYPDEIKHKLFRMVYDNFAPWHDQVFFYLCMENKRHWKPVFGFEYKDNDEFELAMKNAYMNKIKALT
ncbi:hypothetical protein N9N67_00995 [Bacteriovoracaceae bacterium]|nr:hypothetical protein [Bacteriovoracaceae bacterium]